MGMLLVYKDHLACGLTSIAQRQLALRTRLATQVLNQRDAWDLREAVCPSNTIRYDGVQVLQIERREAEGAHCPPLLG